MNTEHQQIRLWPEWLPNAGCDAPANAPHDCDALRLPFAPAHLPVQPKRPLLLTRADSISESGVIAEPFFNQRHQLRLLLTFPSGVTPIVNGERSLHRVVLQTGDVFQWTTGLAFQMAIFNKPRIGRPTEDQVGKPCPVCRVPITKDSTCFTCACGAVLHCEADEVNGLQCAPLCSECPRCRKPIVLEEGYDHTPSHE